MTINDLITQAIGRRITDAWNRETGRITDWSPLANGLCDVRIQRDDGSEVWLSMQACKPVDGKGPLPRRMEAVRLARAETFDSLERIRAKFIEETRTSKWPGAEWGKTLVAKALDGAITEVKQAFDREVG